MLSQRKETILKSLTNEAALIGDNGFQNKIIAAVVHKNKIVTMASNVKKTHTFQKRFAKNDEAIYFHAETHAIHKAIKIIGEDKLKNCELYIVRLSSEMSKRGKLVSQKLANSKPCEGCSECISHFGIKRVFHSIDGGFQYN